MEKLAVITSTEAGIPNLSRLKGLYNISYSVNSSIQEALHGASAAFLWDVSLIDELKRHWNWMQDVKWLHAAVTGIDELCFEELRNSDIILTNAGGIYDNAVAEYALAACLNYERCFNKLRDQQLAHEWKWLQGSALRGKNILIVGPGRIGRTCAGLFHVFRCKVAALGSEHKSDSNLFAFYESSSEAQHYVGWADHIIVTAPLTTGTYHLVNADVLAACKDTAHIVNVGRGSIIDTQALVDALASEQIGGATLDVLEEEPLAPDSPLWNFENVTITPHIAGDVGNFERALITQFIGNARAWAQGDALECIVDKNRGY